MRQTGLEAVRRKVRPVGGRRGFAACALTAFLAAGMALGPCLLGLPGCLWQREELPPATTGDPVTIGIPLPLSGAKAPFGEAKRNGYTMAVEEINAAGGVNGRALALVFRDTGGEPETAAAAAEELVKVDRVCLLAGEYSSACALAVAGVAQRLGIPYLVDTAMADEITQQKWGSVFRLNQPAALLTQGLTGFLDEVARPRSMGLVYEQSDYGTGVARAMRTWCRNNGISVVADLAYEPGDLDFGPIISRLSASDPDVVFAVSYLMDATLLIRQARSQGLSPKLFAGGGAGFVMPEFVQGAGGAAENVVTAASWAPSVAYPGAAEFAETYRARFGDYPTYHAAQSYACIYVIEDALSRACTTDPQRLCAALAETELVTLVGPIRFEKFGKYLNQSRSQTIVLQVQAGKHEVVWPPECATADAVFPDPGPGAPPQEPEGTTR